MGGVKKERESLCLNSLTVLFVGEDKVDRTLGNMYSQRPSQVSDSFESSLSASLTHDTWIRTKESRERKISAQNYSKTVPV